MDDKEKIENNEVESEKETIDTYYEEEETNRKYPSFILLILFTTFGVLLALGLSFSAISYMQSNETINTIISIIKGEDDDKDKYIITYVENTGNYENGINLVNQFPTPDATGKLFSGENYVYNFSLIIGEKTLGAYYEITAVPDASNTLNPEFVKIYLEKNGEEVDFSYRDDKKVKVFTDYTNSEYEGTDGKVIYKAYIDEEDIKNGKIDFVMRMWVSEDAIVDTDYNNKTFAVKVNTYAAFIDG